MSRPIWTQQRMQMNGGLIVSILGGIAVVVATGIYIATRKPKK